MGAAAVILMAVHVVTALIIGPVLFSIPMKGLQKKRSVAAIFIAVYMFASLIMGPAIYSNTIGSEEDTPSR
ncbi:hypothetical protein Nepgr_002858 [Nepenthes gracilis]|uniref:Uncharacterized protein n=1 Tax=Nepenthes gracilis TaxID=150966 RepID=A0AAD3P734_NEPGR|nr:hypothetical protein Nepgr_002858 [Nepenthes gracilis]